MTEEKSVPTATANKKLRAVGVKKTNVHADGTVTESNPGQFITVAQDTATAASEPTRSTAEVISTREGGELLHAAAYRIARVGRYPEGDLLHERAVETAQGMLLLALDRIKKGAFPFVSADNPERSLAAILKTIQREAERVETSERSGLSTSDVRLARTLIGAMNDEATHIGRPLTEAERVAVRAKVIPDFNLRSDRPENDPNYPTELMINGFALGGASLDYTDSDGMSVGDTIAAESNVDTVSFRPSATIAALNYLDGKQDSALASRGVARGRDGVISMAALSAYKVPVELPGKGVYTRGDTQAARHRLRANGGVAEVARQYVRGEKPSAGEHLFKPFTVPGGSLSDTEKMSIARMFVDIADRPEGDSENKATLTFTDACSYVTIPAAQRDR
jgi:hypothetical protein